VHPVVKDRGVRAFLLVWTGQLVSLLGSGITAFALGIWIFQRTQSTTQYALMTFCAAAPPLLALPLAGPFIDRWDRKRLLIACDLVAASAVGAAGVLAYLESLTLPYACVVVAVTAVAGGLQLPIFTATITTLVPREQLGRASGMSHLSHALSQVAAPLLAGALIGIIGLVGIMTVDITTFLFSTALLLIAAIPPGAAAAGRRSYWADVPMGVRHITGHSGLFAILVMFTVVNFFSELAAVLFTPFILGFSTPAALGTIMAIGGAGMTAGGAVLSVWGGPRRPALGAALFAGLGGLCVAAVGFTTSIPLIAAAVAAYFFCLPLMAGSSQVVWQRTVPIEMQGRVFATRAAIAMAAAPLASLAAGPLADGLFEPLMSGEGMIGASLGPWFGSGPGRGIALIFVLTGALSAITAMIAGNFKPLRDLDAAASPAASAEPARAAT